MSSVTNITGFVTLGEGIYIKKPSSAPPLSSVECPSLILIFGWMSAAMPHLMKYTTAYEDLYPSATQILVQSAPSFFWSFEGTLVANMMPLVEALEAIGCIESGEAIEIEAPPLRILTHCFSNGGGCNLSTLHRIITSRQLVTRRKVVSALVLDSLPGKGNFENAKRAFEPSFKHPIAYFYIYTLLVALFTVAWIRGHLIDGVPLFFANMEEDLNSEHLLGWMSKRTPRLYLYSENDELIAVESVQEHAQEAAAKGFDVKLEKFAESKHVSHARIYPQRYWAEIKALWERAVKFA